MLRLCYGLILIAGYTGTAAALTPEPEGLPQSEESDYWLQDEAFVEAAREAIQLMYNQESEASRRVLSPWLEEHPEHPIAHFWDGLELWWYMLADLENETFDATFARYMEAANQAADRMLRQERRHFDALVLKALSNAFLARMHANRENWYNAFQHGRLAFNLLQNISRYYPDADADAAFGFGLYSYFTAYLQDEYRVVRAISWMIPDGDRQLGLQRLEQAAQQGVFVKPEATYFLGHIYLHYEKNPARAERYLLQLQQEHPRNSFFNRLLLRTYFRQERMAEASVLNDALLQQYESQLETIQAQDITNAPIPEKARHNALLSTLEELYSIRGRLHYQQFSYDEAISAFEKAHALQSRLAGGVERRHQRIAAYQIGRSYVRKGNPEAAEPYFKLLASSNENDGLQELAETELQRISQR